MKKYSALGIMSGTSLDGLDFALCNFLFDKEKWTYEISETGFVKYSADLKKELETAHLLSGLNLLKLHKRYGAYIGEKAKEFLTDKEKPQLIASHGHTVFHQPEINLTLQIGDGAFIASRSEISTVSDFRNLDTALGGQGAPLVPVGDELLFSEHDICLNIGGFANLSYKNSEFERIACDICPANFVLNQLMQSLNKAYDKNGETARSGQLNSDLLKQLNALPFYQKKAPKSLGREYAEKHTLPILKRSNIPTADKLRTYSEHIAVQISEISNNLPKGKLLITGGGAHNTFITERIKKHSRHIIYIPEKKIIDFKEALVFAFLGVLRLRNEANCLKSVTGAGKDNIGGSVFLV